MANGTPEQNATGEDHTLDRGPKPQWGDRETAPIYAGVGLGTEDASCTANFVFTSPNNRHVYIGTVAHCVAPPDSHPCEPESSMPFAPGSPVQFIQRGQDLLDVNATLAYSSWYTLRQVGAQEPFYCSPVNDFALVEIPLEATALVTPYFRTGHVPTYIVAPEDIEKGEEILAYGNSLLWPSEAASPKRGIITRGAYSSDQAFSFAVWPIAIFGDSGSGFYRPDGGAVGLVKQATDDPFRNVLQGDPAAGQGGVILATMLEYMHTHTDIQAELAQP